MSPELRTRPRFLVADDTPVIAGRVARTLEDAGVDVIGPACNGAQALQLWMQTHPDAAVLDFEMPEMTGLQVLRAIRAHERQCDPHSHCMVVILSSHAEPSIIDRCLAEGADLYLNKNAAFEQLRDLAARAGRAMTS